MFSGDSAVYSAYNWKSTCIGYAGGYTDNAAAIGGATCGYRNGTCDGEEEKEEVDPVIDSTSDEEEEEEEEEE